MASLEKENCYKPSMDLHLKEKRFATNLSKKCTNPREQASPAPTGCSTAAATQRGTEQMNPTSGTLHCIDGEAWELAAPADGRLLEEDDDCLRPRPWRQDLEASPMASSTSI